MKLYKKTGNPVPATYFFEWQEVEGQKKKDKKRIAVKDLRFYSRAGKGKSYLIDAFSRPHVSGFESRR